MEWTPKQQQAIEEDNNNIIVSAGAGSGKTAVLSERVIRKIKDGHHIDELLILTFTNKAAGEMKERIRKKLIENKFINEASLIDSSYITTFDSFSLSIVKKYNYLLNLPKNIDICDETVLNIEKNILLDKIFDNFYESNNSKFISFMKDFCYKDDNSLKQNILKLYSKLELKIDKDDYLNNYIEKNYNTNKINSDIENFYSLLMKKVKFIEGLINELDNYFDSSFIEKFYNKLSPIINSKNYDELVNSLNIDFKDNKVPNGTDEEGKIIKTSITDTINEIKKLAIYRSSDEIRRETLATRDNMEMLIEIITVFDKELNNIKKKKNMYSFNDISLLGIKLLNNNKDVRDELTNKFNEIMIDEYQDTNDLEEYFISLISNNNTYMVGDIKQSIYRFRNANPYIFKNKYDLYNDPNNGIRIDLLENFRSRNEVLNNINLVFNKLMDNDFGGANYEKEHQMKFGLDDYNNKKDNVNYNLEILTYNNEDKVFNSTEKEAFIIGNDIKNKMNNNYQVYDKDNNILRKSNYSDYVVLIDKSTDFELYKKIFEYLSIPVSIEKDEYIDNDSDILIIRNIIRIINAIDQEKYDINFKYAFMSLARSFLFNYEDEEILRIFNKENFFETDIYRKSNELYNYYYDVSPKVFYLKLLEIFSFEENLLKTTNIEVARKRLEYFYNLISKFEQDGKTINDFIEYLDIIFDSEEKSRFKINNSENNSVKIMTIHASKGLEYPVCYFSGYSKGFNFRDLNEKILYENSIGIVIPYFNNYVKDTIYKPMIKNKVRCEEISEKIRLLYVALTRAREKMIIVTPNFDIEKVGANKEKDKFNSFFDMLNYIYYDIKDYIKEVNVEYTKDYIVNKNTIDINKLKIEDSIVINELNIEKEELEEEKYSKSGIKLITKEEYNKMNVGTKIHEVLEYIDFNNPNYDGLDSFIKDKVSKFINSKLIQDNTNSKFYKEYEFIYAEDNISKHGIIDLMIENDKEIIIVDYKLKNIEDSLYDKQLLGYKKAISTKTNKKIKTYLYSILDEIYKEVI